MDTTKRFQTNTLRSAFSSELPFVLTIFLDIEMLCRVHRDNVDVGFQELEDLIQLFAVTVTVHKDLKLRIASLGLP